MVELAATAVVEVVGNLTNKHKLIVLSVTPTTTSDVITFDQSTGGVFNNAGGGFNKVITVTAVDSSTGIPKAISHNGSTVLTTRGWAPGDNKWFIWVLVKNDFGEVI